MEAQMKYWSYLFLWLTLLEQYMSGSFAGAAAS